VKQDLPLPTCMPAGTDQLIRGGWSRVLLPDVKRDGSVELVNVSNVSGTPGLVAGGVQSLCLCPDYASLCLRPDVHYMLGNIRHRDCVLVSAS
jgi:hypothetical protein